MGDGFSSAGPAKIGPRIVKSSHLDIITLEHQDGLAYGTIQTDAAAVKLSNDPGQHNPCIRASTNKPEPAPPRLSLLSTFHELAFAIAPRHQAGCYRELIAHLQAQWHWYKCGDIDPVRITGVLAPDRAVEWSTHIAGASQGLLPWQLTCMQRQGSLNPTSHELSDTSAAVVWTCFLRACRECFSFRWICVHYSRKTRDKRFRSRFERA